MIFLLITYAVWIVFQGGICIALFPSNRQKRTLKLKGKSAERLLLEENKSLKKQNEELLRRVGQQGEYR